jgi:hypothetical protein
MEALVYHWLYIEIHIKHDGEKRGRSTSLTSLSLVRQTSEKISRTRLACFRVAMCRILIGKRKSTGGRLPTRLCIVQREKGENGEKRMLILCCSWVRKSGVFTKSIQKSKHASDESMLSHVAADFHRLIHSTRSV